MTPDESGHRIRLRGPWTFQWLDDAGNPLGVTGTLRHPADWPHVVGIRSGRMQLTRNFHAPSNLDPDEGVFVVLTGVQGDGAVRLNGKLLGIFGRLQTACEFPCPLPLPFSNVLTIVVSFPAATDVSPDVGLFGTVELEIRTFDPTSPQRKPTK